MTEDTSPENLRKFLESNDPALVTMGLSMAKGVGVPDKMLEKILWMYMFHDDKTIRAAAKSTFMKIAPEDAKQAVKENWKASYRTDCLQVCVWPATEGQAHLGMLGKVLCQTSVSLIWPLIKALGDENKHVHSNGSRALGKIGKPAVEPLIEVLGDENFDVRWGAMYALGKIGDTRAVEPLIETLRDEELEVRKGAVSALGEIGDARAVEPLKMILVAANPNEPFVDSYVSNWGVRRAAKEALRKLGHEVK